MKNLTYTSDTHKMLVTKLKQMSIKLLIPIIVLGLLAILSTLLPTDIQQRPAALGLPVILWFWFGISISLVALNTIFAWRFIRGGNHD